MVCNPHNPLGTVYSEKQILECMEFAERYSMCGIWKETLLWLPYKFRGDKYAVLISKSIFYFMLRVIRVNWTILYITFHDSCIHIFRHSLHIIADEIYMLSVFKEGASVQSVLALNGWVFYVQYRKVSFFHLQRVLLRKFEVCSSNHLTPGKIWFNFFACKRWSYIWQLYIYSSRTWSQNNTVLTWVPCCFG